MEMWNLFYQNYWKLLSAWILSLALRLRWSRKIYLYFLKVLKIEIESSRYPVPGSMIKMYVAFFLVIVRHDVLTRWSILFSQNEIPGGWGCLHHQHHGLFGCHGYQQTLMHHRREESPILGQNSTCRLVYHFWSSGILCSFESDVMLDMMNTLLNIVKLWYVIWSNGDKVQLLNTTIISCLLW